MTDLLKQWLFYTHRSISLYLEHCKSKSIKYLHDWLRSYLNVKWWIGKGW